MWCWRVGLWTVVIAIARLGSAARAPGNASAHAVANGTVHVSANGTGARSLARSSNHTFSKTAINGTVKLPSAPNATLKAVKQPSAPNATLKVKANALVPKEGTNASRLISPASLSGVLPHFLAKQGLEAQGGACACHFEDRCSCSSTMEFMDCIATACASGKCECQDYQFHHACLSISSTCPDLELECSIGQAQCLYERESRYQGPEEIAQKSKHAAEDIYDSLQDLKERKCRLQLQVEDGWLNSEKHLEGVTADISKLMDELIAMKEKRPEMHCEKHFEEWHYPETLTPAAPARNAGVVAVPGLIATLLVALATVQ